MSLLPTNGHGTYLNELPPPTEKIRASASRRQFQHQGEARSFFFRLCGGSSAASGRGRVRGAAPTSSSCSALLRPEGTFGVINPMGKGKSDKSKVPAEVRHHVVVQGDLYLSLIDYMKKNPAGVITERPPGQPELMPAPDALLLDSKTRLIIFLLIDLLDDLVNAGICVEKLKSENIAILSDGRPKLVNVIFVERNGLSGGLKEFKETVCGNYEDLSVIISRYVMDVAPVPAELTHLLHLMKHHAWGMRLLINYHAATVPIENYCTLYIRIHNFTWDILFPTDPKGFKYVMKNMEVDPVWRTEIFNKHLLAYYTKSSYENLEPPGTRQHLFKETWQVCRLNRNGPSHPLEFALDTSSADAMSYSQCAGLGHIYRSHFARLTYSLQSGLQAINRLRLVEIKSLFSNSLKVHKEIR